MLQADGLRRSTLDVLHTLQDVVLARLVACCVSAGVAGCLCWCCKLTIMLIKSLTGSHDQSWSALYRAGSLHVWLLCMCQVISVVVRTCMQALCAEGTDAHMHVLQPAAWLPSGATLGPETVHTVL